MSDKSFIKISNGSSITADSNFANKATIEEFLKTYLRTLKANPLTKGYFSSENPSDYEVNVLPVPLKDTTQLSTEILTDKRDFASARAELEARKYASLFYDPTNKEYVEFYRNFMPGFIDNVKRSFMSSDSDGNVRILSQTSFLRLSQAMVNIMLRKKPDGTDNMCRRRKAKVGEFTTDSEGNQVRVYYSDEEIAEAEIRLYNEHNAHNFVSLDLTHLPFGIESCILSAASLMSVDRTDRSDTINEFSIDDIFSPDAEDSDTICEQFRELSIIAKRDLGIIDLIESRSTSGDILEVIHADCDNRDVRAASTDKLTMREKYTSLLFFIRFIITIAAPLIDIVRLKGCISYLTKGDIEKIVGIDESLPDNYMSQYQAMLADEDFRRFLAGLPFKYRISEHMFTVLLVSLVKRATVNAGVNAHKIIDAFATHIGYHRADNPNHLLIKNLFKYLTVDVPETAVEDLPGFVGTVEGRREPMVSYAYRNTPRYLHEDGKFGIELPLIDLCVNTINHKIINARGNLHIKSTINILNNTFTFNIDSLVQTVSRIMHLDNLTDSMNPFASYKNDLIKKNQDLDKRRLEVSNMLNETYGFSFPAYFVPMPSIPYNNSERDWARKKCVAIAEEIKAIQSMNPSYDWENFRTAYGTLENMSREFASAKFEDPDVVEALRLNQEIFDIMCTECNLSSDNLSALKKLEEDLRFYSNIDDIHMKFIPFQFDFKKSLGNEMKFHLSKASIVQNGIIRTVQSLIGNPDLTDILGSYFRPFFEPYATINTDAFDIKFETTQRVDTKSKNPETSSMITSIIMVVNYGSSDDLHVASKFRTRFPCILDTNLMLKIAREDAGKSEDDPDFTIADIPDKFIIKWGRDLDQNNKLAGPKGESALKLMASTRGCYEQYPAYDFNMMRIVTNAFRIVKERYINSQNIKNSRLAEMNKPKRIIGKSDEFGFAAPSQAALDQKEHSRNVWSALALTSKGVSVDPVATVTDISKSNSMIRSNKQDPRAGLFGGKKNSSGTTGVSNIGKKEGSHTIENSHGDAVIQAFTKERMIKKLVKGPDGYNLLVYEKKTITSYQRVGGSTPQDMRDRRDRSGKTPKRHQQGVRQDNNQRSRHATGGNGRRNGTPNASKATPVSLGGSSPARGNSNSASPAIQKRGYAPGAASPTSFGYFQPDHENFNASVPINMYPGATSPAQNLPQLFQEVEVPTGVFHVDNGTPRENGTNNSRGSQGSRLASSIASTTTPTQNFEVNDDDFEI